MTRLRLQAVTPQDVSTDAAVIRTWRQGREKAFLSDRRLTRSAVGRRVVVKSVVLSLYTHLLAIGYGGVPGSLHGPDGTMPVRCHWCCRKRWY